MHMINQTDRSFLNLPATQPPITGFFLDFHGEPPSIEQLSARFGERLHSVPALTMLPPAKGVSKWRPTPVGEVDLGIHLHHRVLPADSEALASACNQLLGCPLPDAAHPQWDLWLLTQEATPDRFRMCFRIHHGFQDGVGAAYSTLALLADSSVDGPPLYPATGSSVAQALRAFLTLGKPLFIRRSTWLGACLSNSSDTGTSADSAPLRWSYHDVPTERLRKLADMYRTSVNDVSLAALAIALQSWGADHAGNRGSARSRLLTIMSTRRPSEKYFPGNFVGADRLELPCAAATIDVALADVRRQTDIERHTNRRDAARAVLNLPGPLRPRARMLRMLNSPRFYPLLASSITYPEAFSCFDAHLSAASMILNVGDLSPVYLSFTRTPTTVRCTVVTDEKRLGAIDIPRRWALALIEE